jgi:2-iminobutanoate/2-iminopropanoate deaminase
MQRSTFIIALLALFCAGPTLGADKTIVSPPGTRPGGNYSPGILIDGTLYISGQGGEDAAGKIPGDFGAEVKQCLDNIGAILKAARMSPADVVSVQVYLTDAKAFQRMNVVYSNYFKDPRPARTTVVVAGLVGPGNIEITVRGVERRVGGRTALLGVRDGPAGIALFKGEYKCLMIVSRRIGKMKRPRKIRSGLSSSWPRRRFLTA